jgi:hypothetical protein
VNAAAHEEERRVVGLDHLRNLVHRRERGEIEATEMYVELRPLQPRDGLGDMPGIGDRGVIRLAIPARLAELLAERRWAVPDDVVGRSPAQ